MGTASKHSARSGYASRSQKPFAMFAQKARLKKFKKDAMKGGNKDGNK